MKKSIKPIGSHLIYLFSLTEDIVIRTRQIYGEDGVRYSINPSENPRAIVVKTCSYDQNMILFGRIESLHEDKEEIVDIFKDLKKWMRGKYKKRDRFYVSKTILENPDQYRLITVIGNPQSTVFDLKI